MLRVVSLSMTYHHNVEGLAMLTTVGAVYAIGLTFPDFCEDFSLGSFISCSSRGAAKDFSHGRKAVDRIERRMSRGSESPGLAPGYILTALKG